MKRLMPRALVVLTVLVVLGAGGYAGQVWWAKRVARNAIMDSNDLFHIYCWIRPKGVYFDKGESDPQVIDDLLNGWKDCPWWGHITLTGWNPRRTYYEVLTAISEQTFPNDPSVWEAWFKAHPDLVWDEKLKRLVDAKPGVAP